MAPEFVVAFSTTNVLAVVCILLLTLYIWSWLKVPKDLPPGPKGVPLLGFLPFLKKDLLHQFRDLANEHGEIFSFYLGHKLIIVLNSYELIKEAFVSENFSGRPVAHELKNQLQSFINSEKDVFRDHKRFAFRTLREFGFGKHSLEPSIKEEISFLLEKIKSLSSQPTDIGGLIRMSVSNVICALLHGKRFDYEDEHFQALTSLVSEHLSRVNPILAIYFVSLMSKIPGITLLMTLLKTNFMQTDQLLYAELRKKVEERAKNHEHGVRNDFISAWLSEAEEKRKTDTNKHFSNHYLTRTSQTLFIAGTDTTTNSLRWSLLYLIANPAVQRRVQNEIDEVVGHERMPSLTDQDQMPYSVAVIMEIQRLCSLLPLGFFHSNFETTKLKNFTIPKRSVITSNLWAVHHDPNVFPNPEEFRPERFLDKEGKFINEEKLIPFSVGKRQCLGESLARMELFLYFTSLFQQFSFESPRDQKLNFHYDTALVTTPKPFKVIAIKRQN